MWATSHLYGRVWDGQRKYDPARDDIVEIGDSELMPRQSERHS